MKNVCYISDPEASKTDWSRRLVMLSVCFSWIKVQSLMQWGMRNVLLVPARADPAVQHLSFSWEQDLEGNKDALKTAGHLRVFSWHFKPSKYLFIYNIYLYYKYFSVSWTALSISEVFGLSSSSLMRISINQFSKKSLLLRFPGAPVANISGMESYIIVTE